MRRSLCKPLLLGCLTAWALIITTLTLLNWYGLQLRVVSGSSMAPTIHDGAIILVLRYPTYIAVNDIVTAQVFADKEIVSVVKRVIETNGEGLVHISGDNPLGSFEAWVHPCAITGKVVAVLYRGHPQDEQ